MIKSSAKSKLYFSIVFLLFLVMGVGYALIGSNLGVSNSITVLGYESKVIYDLMKVNAAPDNTSSTYVSSESGISFSAVGSDTNGKGVYMIGNTADDTYPIYYYRGPITNNNLKFANFCWKIVRTTNTGGVKILYNGVPASDGSCNNEGDAAQVGLSAFNTYTNPSLSDVGFMYGTRYETTQKTSMGSTKFKYGNDVTYSGGTYTLQNVSTSTSSYTFSYTNLRKGYHYSCLSTATSCNPVYYIYSFAISSVHYATLSNGLLLSQHISAATDGVTNTTSSTIKTYLDNWYDTNLKNYASYLEDTVWCNDRSIYELNGWDKDSSSSSDLHFNGYARNFLTYKPSVVCVNSNDRFSVSTSVGNGKLTNPIGLVTADEIILASGGANDYINTGSYYWTMTPSYYGDTGTGAHNYIFGDILESISSVNAERGVRPMVSLKPGTEYSSGDGSIENPFVVG